MYAVIETGGKQYRVELGSELVVERLDGAPGDTIRFDRVLLVADGENASIGTPVVDDALVTANLLRQDRGEKVTVFKYRPKARHRAKRGHRQEQTVVRVADIQFAGRSAASEAEVVQKEASKAKAKAAADAEKKASVDQALATKLEREATKRADEAKAEKSARAEKSAKPESAVKAATKAKPTATKAAPKKATAPKPAAKAALKKSSEPKPSAKKATSAKTDADKKKG